MRLIWLTTPYQLTSPPIEATLFRHNGKLIPMFLHITEQLRFLVPAAAFTDWTHSCQFAVTTRWQLLAQIVSNHKCP